MRNNRFRTSPAVQSRSVFFADAAQPTRSCDGAKHNWLDIQAYSAALARAG